MDTQQAARLISIPTAFMVAGYQFCLSQSTLPVLYTQPASISTTLFNPVFNRGAAVVVPAAILTPAAFGYLAYTSQNQTQRRLYTAGAILAFCQLPWTILIMNGGITRLLAISQDTALQTKTGQTGEALRLLQTWSAQNWVRCGIWFSAGIAGLLASL